MSIRHLLHKHPMIRLGLVLALVLLAIPAQRSAAAPAAQGAPGVADVSFEQLQEPTFSLFSPIDQRSFDFLLPYRWQLVGGQQFVDIRYAMTYEGYDPAAPPEANVELNAMVDVSINNTLLGSFTPQPGDAMAIQLPIPPDLLNDPESNRHRLRVSFRTENCENPRQARLTVQSSSLLHLEYEMRPLELNLAAFPRPLVQERLTPETVVLVIPDAYTHADLSAAASLAATLGSQVSRDTANTLLVTAAQTTPELLADKGAIIIGTPQRNDFLASLYARGLLPTTLSPDSAAIIANAAQPVMPDDGVLQLISSDVNPDQAYLIVTASTDIGVYRAARALSMREPRYGLVGNLGIVAAVSDLGTGSTARFTDTVTLNDLDYFDTPFYGIGTQSNGVDILIPASWQFKRNPVLRMRYMHSAGLQPEASALNVLLNGRPVASAPLGGTQQGERQIEIELPKDEFQPGRVNYLTFEGVVKQTAECNLPPDEAIWMRVLGTSELSLRHVENEDLRIPSEDVRMFFTSRPDMGNVWFALSESPTNAELAALSDTAWALGRVSQGQGFAPLASRGIITDTAFLNSFSVLADEAVPATQAAPTQADAMPILDQASLLTRYHVLAFGLPASNPLLAALNAELPQSFGLETNSLSQQVGNVIYRLPNDMSLGVVELLPAPWNAQRVVLAATGTSPEGVAWSVAALNSGDRVTQLTGDVNFVVEQHIEAVNSARVQDVPVRSAVERLTDEEMQEELVVAADEPAATAPAAVADQEQPLPALPEGRAEQYVSQQAERPWIVTMVIIGLISSGLLIGSIGALLSWRSARKQTATTVGPADIPDQEDAPNEQTH
jgi:hypothetical protein